MGIKQLMQMINEKASKAVKRLPLSSFSGQVIACDASMAIYQFLIATKNGTHYNNLTDESGTQTGHLLGIFYRTIQFLDDGIRPIWVFDGKAPALKSKELNRRKKSKAQARDSLITQNFPSMIPPELLKPPKQKKKEPPVVEPEKKAKRKLSIRQWQIIQKKKYEDELNEIEMSIRERITKIAGNVCEISCGDYMCLGESDEEQIDLAKELDQIMNTLESKGCSAENIDEAKKFVKRATHVTTDMVQDVKEMLIYMGVPVIDAPSEAEAQCAELVKCGKAFAVASEDMDALAFGTPVLLRGFGNKKEPIVQIDFQEVLTQTDLNYDEFVDLCILLGCDYSKTIPGIGAAKALRFIKQCSKIENVIEFLASSTTYTYNIPEDFNYEDARALFKKPNVVNGKSFHFEWSPPNEEKVKEFLVGSKGFSQIRVENSLKRLKKTHIGNQPKIENFFNGPKKRIRSFDS